VNTAVLLPGFGGRADQPILVKLEARLVARGWTVLRLAPPRLPLTPGLEAYVEWLWGETRTLKGSVALVGRSFGGRLAIRIAARRRLSALALLGFPVRPPRKPRPLDEAALAELTCPTLIVQGTKDALGPLKVLVPLVKSNPRLELHELAGAGHSFGSKEQGALDVTAAWLDRTIRGG
jgi:predicted alpha/beta-hydrolase family hydrolase